MLLNLLSTFILCYKIIEEENEENNMFALPCNVKNKLDVYIKNLDKTSLVPD